MKATLGICLAVFVCLSGCAPAGHPLAGEMSRAELARAAGLDARTGGVVFSVASEGATGGATARSAFGGSVAQAASQVRTMGNSSVYLGHVDQLVLHRQFAADGLPELLDFLSRDRQIGPGARLWVLREGTAEQAMLRAQAAARLEQMETEGVAQDGTAARLMSVLARQGSLCLPALRYVTDNSQDGQTGDLLPDGCAVIRAGRLVGFLDELQGAGLALLLERGAGQVTVLALPDGTKVSLRLSDCQVRCRPVFDQESLAGAEIHCEVQAELIQSQGRLTHRQQAQAEQALARVLQQRVGSVLGCAQFWDADFIGLEQRLCRRCPWRARQIESEWAERFRTLDLQPRVQVNLKRTADME